MLASAPKLIKAVGDWASGETATGNAWTFGDGRITAPINNAAFQVWDTWRRGAWPLDNWLKTPLSLLAQIAAIDLAFNTASYFHSENPDLSKLSGTQRSIMVWLQT